MSHNEGHCTRRKKRHARSTKWRHDKMTMDLDRGNYRVLNKTRQGSLALSPASPSPPLFLRPSSLSLSVSPLLLSLALFPPSLPLFLPFSYPLPRVGRGLGRGGTGWRVRFHVRALIPHCAKGGTGCPVRSGGRDTVTGAFVTLLKVSELGVGTTTEQQVHTGKRTKKRRCRITRGVKYHIDSK